MMNKIDIAMITCNRARISETSIKEIKKRTLFPHRLLVLDNGSGDETPQMLQRLYREGYIDLLILNRENTGVHWGKNQLLSLVESQWFISTDDDIVPCEPTSDGDWLKRLGDLGSVDVTGSIAALSCTPHVFIGASLPEDPPLFWERSHCGSVLRMMNTKQVRGVGGWRKEKDPSRDNEEWWICGKLRDDGGVVGYATQIPVIHLFGEEQYGEDPWGYPGIMKPNEHGHREIWPPVNNYSWERMGIDWNTCKPTG